MNIKNPTAITSIMAPVIVQTKRKSQGTSPDRDSNGKRDREEAPLVRKLTDEEFEKCIEALKNLDGVKQNQLEVKTQIINDMRIVTLVSPLGEVIRRIPEGDLVYLLNDTERKSGNILDKAM